jgi:glucose/arabinose dehydrogenase
VVSCNKDEIFNELIPETGLEPTSSQVQGYVFKPALVPALDANISQLKLPAGFSVNKFAENLGKPRIIVTSPTGNVYATDREAGTVTMLQDTNGDGVADAQQVVANIKQVHELTIYNNLMYMIAVREVYSAAMNVDGTLGQP